jgi:hypothetical protein
MKEKINKIIKQIEALIESCENKDWEGPIGYLEEANEMLEKAKDEIDFYS